MSEAEENCDYLQDLGTSLWVYEDYDYDVWNEENWDR